MSTITKMFDWSTAFRECDGDRPETADMQELSEYIVENWGARGQGDLDVLLNDAIREDIIHLFPPGCQLRLDEEYYLPE